MPSPDPASQPASQAPAQTDQSGVGVARLFQRLLALVLLVAWASLGSQLPTLVGSRGLLPARALMERARQGDRSWLDLPTLFWLGSGDGWLLAGAVLGALLALLALFQFWPRLCFALSAPLYLSYATVCSSFTAFQWDNMLVESCLLAALLPWDRPAPTAHLLFRMLLFKLYFESGIAKWQSHLGDWQDGSAMLHYFQTAPLPTRLAWYAHQLPDWVHRLESWATLVLELLIPFLIFGPRRARLFTFLSLTGFQLINTATANYGFFTYLSLALHVFLLSEADLARLRGALWRRRPAMGLLEPPTAAAAHSHGRLGLALLISYGLLSGLGGAVHFLGKGPIRDALAPIYRPVSSLRAVNVYHLFSHITRERIEPQVQLRLESGWVELDLHYKPGRLDRPPPLVAPHQPRVDFRLWFYGLGFQRGMPRYVRSLLERLCDDPAAVQPLFSDALPASPREVRLAFYRYRFTTPQERQRSGHYWQRELLGSMPSRSCR